MAGPAVVLVCSTNYALTGWLLARVCAEIYIFDEHRPRDAMFPPERERGNGHFSTFFFQGVSDWIAGSCQVLCHRWLSAGPEIQRSDQHLALLPHPLSSVAGQHLFIATHAQFPVMEARIGFYRLHRLALVNVKSDSLQKMFTFIYLFIFLEIHYSLD